MLRHATVPLETCSGEREFNGTKLQAAINRMQSRERDQTGETDTHTHTHTHINHRSHKKLTNLKLISCTWFKLYVCYRANWNTVGFGILLGQIGILIIPGTN